MQISQRDKTALTVAAVALAVFVLLQFLVFPVWDSWQQAPGSVAVEAKKLEKFREIAQTLRSRKAKVSAVEAKVREAEGGLLKNKTAPLASAELAELVQRLTAARAIDVRSSDFLPAKPLSPEYVQVPLALHFQCRLDQFVNLLKDMATNQKYLTVRWLAVQSGGAKDKTVTVSMQVAGVMRAS